MAEIIETVLSASQPTSYIFSDTVYGRSFMTSLVSLRQNSHFTDVVLCAGDREIPCHKVILSAASPYFLAMFNSGLEESTSSRVEIKGIDGETLNTVVNYIYSTDIVITAVNVQSLIQACELFHFSVLKLACERFMLQQVDATNCVGFYEFSKLYGLKHLRDGARRCMLTMFKYVVSGSEFKEMTSEALIEYVCDDNLDVRTEDPVFEGMSIWIQHNEEERRRDAERVLSHVRFPFCSSAFLCHVVEKDSMVTSFSECQQFLEEARLYHMLPEKRHEWKGSRMIPRKSFGMTRKLVLVGGLNKEEKENRYCWYLKEETSTWELLAQIPKPSWKFYSICIVQNGIVITGGYHGNVKRECWLFDTLEKKWKPVVSMIDARCKHRSVVHEDSVYVIGGEDDFDRPLCSIERLNLRTKQWSSVQPMEKALSDPLVVSLGRYIYVFGGIESDDATSTYTMAFDTVWETWSTKKEMPEPCRLGAAAAINSVIYVVGGYSRTCLKYEPCTDQWTKLSTPREKHGNAPAVVWNGRLLLGGGDVDMNETTSVVEEYHADKDVWSYWKLALKEELSCHNLLNVDLPGL